MLQSFMVPGCHVEGLPRESRSLVLMSARLRRDDARCPDCSCPSNAVNGYYRRHPADLPLCGRQIRLELRFCRYVCINPGCRPRTFVGIFPEQVLRTPVPSIVDPYLPHLEIWGGGEGCENGTQLWREVGELGFAGRAQQVRRWLQVRRTVLHKHTSRRWRDVALPGATAPLPAPRKLFAFIQLAWLIVKAAETRSVEELHQRLLLAA